MDWKEEWEGWEKKWVFHICEIIWGWHTRAREPPLRLHRLRLWCVWMLGVVVGAGRDDDTRHTHTHTNS